MEEGRLEDNTFGVSFFVYFIEWAESFTVDSVSGGREDF